MNYLIYNNEVKYLNSLKDEVPEEIINFITTNGASAIISDDTILLISFIKYYYKSEHKLLFLHSDNYDSKLKSIIVENNYNIIEAIKGEIKFEINGNDKSDHSEISLFTSGTTGTPKLISHTWNSLNTFSNVKSSKPNNWLVTYLPSSYAWYQMIIMSFEIENQNIIIPGSQNSGTLFSNINPCDITAISSTPSFWRYQLFNNSAFLLKLNLKQITLGGEYVDQNILDTLSELYPTAKISHIYASTEAGANIVVNDKMEGFPEEWLENRKDRMKVVDNILYLKSEHSSIKNKNSWYHTGDLVKVKNGRIVIIGRENNNVVNIGGNKVNLKFVESIIKNNGDVLHCEVFTKKTPVVNNILVAKIILKNGLELKEYENSLVTYCKQNGLHDWMIPRRWYKADDIVLSNNFKIAEEAAA